MSEAVTAHTWKRILDPASPVMATVADSAAEGVIGLCNYILHENTWETTPVCYLEDLFVAPGRRAVVGVEGIEGIGHGSNNSSPRA